MICLCTDCNPALWGSGQVGQGRYKGDKLTSVLTLSACQAECVKDNMCSGVDWDVDVTFASNERCYLLRQVIGTHTKSSVTHYDLLNRCPTSKHSYYS